MAGLYPGVLDRRPDLAALDREVRTVRPEQPGAVRFEAGPGSLRGSCDLRHILQQKGRARSSAAVDELAGRIWMVPDRDPGASIGHRAGDVPGGAA